MDKTKKKVLVLGEAGVGKSSLVQTYCTNGQQLTKDYMMTLVADIASKIVEVDDEIDVELFFFDVSGREMLRTSVAQMVYLVYLDFRSPACSVRLRFYQRVLILSP